MGAKLVFSYALFFLQLQYIFAKDFCQFKCRETTNFACGHDQKPAKICVDYEALDFNKDDKELVLKKHNEKRKFVTTGKAVNGEGTSLLKATDMTYLEWDDDLAYLAKLNVLQCKMAHDKCRNTEYDNGQNLFNAMATYKLNKTQIIEQAVDMWFDEIKYEHNSDIKKFEGSSNGKVIGHFTQVVWSRTTKLGCSASSFKHDKFNSYLLACNYRHGNMKAAQANKYYCQYTCNNGKTNLGCDHSQEPDETCVDFKRLRLGAKEQQIILDEHNRLRSLVATGQAKNGKGEKLPPAKNMNHLLWCNEMAYLAYLNVLQCKMRHDECRDTYTQNGQNLYNVMSSTNLTIEHVIRTGIEMWFDEIEDVELSEIESFTGGKGKIIGHFTQLVWAKSTYVGCALATYKRGNLNSYLLACNYVNGNMLFESVYDAGKTCAECSSCTDTGLCKPYSPY